MDHLEAEEAETLEGKTAVVAARLKSLPIIRDIFARLRKKLPDNLRYHREFEDEEGYRHTEDVLHETILFALADGISDEHSLELLGIAASYHDAGFLTQFSNNEEIGAGMAVEAMKQNGGYTEEDREIVLQAIMATKVEMVDGVLRQRPAPDGNRLAGYLLDADLSNFGRPDCREKSDLVFTELVSQNPENSLEKQAFLKATYGFISNHQWKTDAAKRLRSVQQQINIQALGQELGIAA